MSEKVLIVEDEAITAHNVEHILKSCGYDDISILQSGEEAVEFVKSHPPSIILMDILLNGAIDGITAASEIQKEFDIPIIYVTGRSEDNLLSRAKATGPAGFIFKPINQSDLKSLVEKAVFKHEADTLLHTSEEKYRSLIENLPDVVVRSDRNTRLLFMSPSAEKIFNITAAEYAGRTLREMNFPEEQCRFWEDHIRQVYDTGSAHETEFLYDRGSEPVLFNWRLWPERNREGNVVSVLSFARDITEHRKTEQRYSMIFNQMLDGFAIQDILVDENGVPADYRFLTVNPAFEHMTGLKAGHTIGKKATDIFPHLEPYWMETYGKVAHTGEPIRFEEYSQDLKKYFEVVAFSTKKGSFATIFHDITMRKETEKLMLLQRDLGIALSSARDIHYALSTVVDTAAKIQGIDMCAAYLIGPETRNMDRIAVIGLPDELMQATARYSRDSKIAGLVFQGKPLYTASKECIIKILYSEGDRGSQPEQFTFFGILPVLYGYNPIASLHIASRSSDDISPLTRSILESIASQIGSVIARLRIEDEIQKSLKEKEILLKEIHHRVKNNMQIISSIINLQMMNIQDEKNISLFRNCQDRIRAMALVHEKLYSSVDFTHIRFDEYVKEIVEGITRSYAETGSNIVADIQIRDVNLDIDRAIPCGLIINELVTNSLKYAFPDGRNGNIGILFDSSANGKYELIVSDNGIGLPHGFDPGYMYSLGFDLVNALATQLGGTLEISSVNGTTFRLRF
jgi:PAS domain S-box-containing protein